MTTIEQLAAFHQFALNQINTGSGLTLGELIDQWSMENMTPEELIKSAEVIKLSLQDWEHGNKGVSLEEFKLNFGEPAKNHQA